jgi:hypothetical protein
MIHPTPATTDQHEEAPSTIDENELATMASMADKDDSSTRREPTSSSGGSSSMNGLAATANDDDQGARLRLAEYRSTIAEYEKELESPSLSQAKRYALKRSLAMEHSKLIREERRLGLRK